MKTRPFPFIVLITVVVTGIFIWISSYYNHNIDFTIPFVLSVLFAFAFSILTELQLRKIMLATTIGVIIALVTKIIIDWQLDPTSHNLFPFEIMIDLFVISIASLIGATIGLVYRRLRKRKLSDNK